jgi:DNA modification methylase
MQNNCHLAQRIELWPLARIRLREGNPRVHPPAQVAQIAASIQEWGFNAPILVNRDGVLTVGEGRYLGAVQLGLAEVPVIVLEHLSEAQQRAYRISDNQIGLNSSWDEETLRAELEKLVQEAINLDLLAFSQQELARLLASPELQTFRTDEDEIPDAGPVVTSNVGDMWLLGNHRLLCSDATVRDNIDRVMQSEQAAMCFVDPPYGVGYLQSRKGKAPRGILNDNLGDGFGAFLELALRNILAVTSGAVYVAMSSSELDTLQLAFRKAGGHWSTFIVWVKDGAFTLGRSDYQRGYEVMLYGWREGATRFWCGARNKSDAWVFPKPRANKLHPTMKPVALVEEAINNSSPPGSVVLDSMAGSGSTLIACQKTGRVARLIELDPQYVDVIVRRWEEFTGKEATLEGDGRTFAQVSEARLNKAEVEVIA